MKPNDDKINSLPRLQNFLQMKLCVIHRNYSITLKLKSASMNESTDYRFVSSSKALLNKYISLDDINFCYAQPQPKKYYPNCLVFLRRLRIKTTKGTIDCTTCQYELCMAIFRRELPLRNINEDTGSLKDTYDSTPVTHFSLFFQLFTNTASFTKVYAMEPNADMPFA